MDARRGARLGRRAGSPSHQRRGGEDFVGGFALGLGVGGGFGFVFEDVGEAGGGEGDGFGLDEFGAGC